MARERIGRIAVASLGLALALVALGKCLELAAGLPFLGGMIAAFGEAALVGGLADWFAVRALFTRPFGIPFPHAALIPRNRRRITEQIRHLVVNEWLPRDLLARKLGEIDFVQQVVLPGMPALRPHLREWVRAGLLDLLTRLDPRHAASWVEAETSPQRLALWLAELLELARERKWFEPLVRELVGRLEEWASSPQCQQVIRSRLVHATESYRQRGSWQDFVLTIGQISGGLDLVQATNALQGELVRFAGDQLDDDSQMKAMLREGMLALEGRLRDDPQALEQLSGALTEAGSLTDVLAKILTPLRDETLAHVESGESPWLDLAVGQIDAWLERLQADPTRRERLNGWCRELALGLLERHHAFLGTLVEEQMNRLSDDEITRLIEQRVGEDLNWIRLNGTFVGGMIGVALYLVVELIRWAAR